MPCYTQFSHSERVKNSDSQDLTSSPVILAPSVERRFKLCTEYGCKNYAGMFKKNSAETNESDECAGQKS